ncbi:MAG: ABC-2 type transport system ATP-binding protein, partial [Planctomycetota bacterium]
MVSTNDSLISVRDLRKTYRSGLMGRKRHEALKGVSLEVGRGQVFGLLGPNGAGKTTMIKVLLGLIKNFEGDAMMFGRPVGPAELRQRVGYLPEAHLLPPYLTGRQVLELFGQFSGLTHSALRKLVPHWLDRVGVADSANRKVKEYSKGMKQRLGLAQALIHEPELVFLDEPTDGVDPVGRKEIRDIVEEARQGGATLFLNSHLLMEVQQMCDQIVILNNGKIQRSGSVEDMAKETEAVHFHLHTEAQINSQRLISDLGRDARWEGKALVI